MKSFEIKKTGSVFCLLLSFAVCICKAQNTNSFSDTTASSYFEEVKQVSLQQTLWGKQIYGPMLLVDARSRITWSNTPDSAGILKPVKDAYKGILPKEIILANTSITWQGKKWAVILLPLPQNHDDRLNLMVHESFHRIQNELGLPANSPTIAHLNTMNGRIYFLLELQALKAALAKPVNERKADLANALLFRDKRHLLFPETFKNERLLEMNEGLAEYTGVMLGRNKDSIRNHLYTVINGADKNESLIRSSAYITGPVYGYLLVEQAPDWNLKINAGSDLPALIANYYHINLQKHNLNAEVSRQAIKYNGANIINSEKQKEKAHLEKLKQYTNLFIKKPVLTIALVNMNIGFDPNNLFDMGQYGTVYPTAEVKDNWGSVKVFSNGMLMKDWKVIYLPMTAEVRTDNANTGGPGWSLTINPGWKIVKTDSLHYNLVRTK